jgi:DNA mismatch repair protein MutL
MSNSRILALSEDCINKIAAGEVIERPASVLKELVENSLDAQATRIDVVIEEGGKSLLKISDNGSGIVREDMKICWLRYTTSKIRQADDLNTLVTNGFRGEALSSIAAVSRLSICSRTVAEDSALEIEIFGGVEHAQNIVARDVGTTMTVKDLFYNMPVRSKFLASSSSETTRIVSMLTRLALAHPHVSFSLKQQGKELLDLKSADYQNRLMDVFGSGVSRHFIAVDFEKNGVHISGFVARPEAPRAKRGQQYFYLADRPVWNSVLLKALERGYEMLYPGHSPVAVLFIQVPAGSVDVNVHPTKHEVRFEDSLDVFSVISNAIRETLLADEKRPQLHSAENNAPSLNNSRNSSAMSENSGMRSSISMENAEWKEDLFAPKAAPILPSAADLFESRHTPNIVSFGSEQMSQVHQKQDEMIYEQEERWTPKIQLLQLKNSYIAMETQSGLTLIDQQRAHERILFEQARKNLDLLKSLPSKQLLFPEMLELSNEEMRILGENSDRFQALGFDVEPFGISCYQMRGIPLEMEPEAAKNAVLEMITDIRTEKPKGDQIRESMAQSFARRTALRNGTPLSQEEMNSLVDQLFSPHLENPYISPFGKPVIIKIGHDDLDKKFGKV